MKPILICIYTSFAFAMTISVVFAQDMVVHADATEIHRHLLKTTTEYEVSAGEVALLYPEWIPGIHGPRNALQNLAEIIVEDEESNRLEWQRDPDYAFRFFVDVPSGVSRIVVKLTYICNQPSVNSRSVDSYGTPLIGVINWNTCLLYPEGSHVNQIDVDTKLTMPEHWEYGCSMVEESREAGTVDFETVSLEELIDTPVIMGEYFRTLDISPDEGPPHYLHMVAEADHELRPEERTVQNLKDIVTEGMKLFGRAHFDEYHFLLVLSDNVPGIGLEHLKSSLNSVGNNGLIDENAIEGTGVLLAHEYGHSWCGKYRRPAGMNTPNFNTPKDTRLLWVYEGLDTYLGEVLGARSGIIAKEEEDVFEQALKRVGRMTHGKMAQKGRRTIDLQDVASSAYLRRGGSEHWRFLNRPQDYYYEGQMMWMYCDAIIRNQTDGEKSLDDFLESFLGYHEEAKTIVEFEEEELIRRLNEVLEYDWQSVIDLYVKDWQEELPLDFLQEAGYRVQYSNEPTEYDENMIFTSLGMRVSGSGDVSAVVPGKAADQAGLYKGMRIIGIDGKKYSENRLKDAIADSVANHEIELLVLQGETYETITIPYDEGPKYFNLVRNEDKPDWLKELFEPLVTDNGEE